MTECLNNVDTLKIIKTLSEVEGPCSVHNGMLWLEDGTSIDLSKAAKNKSQYLNELRLAGYAVAIFSPGELGNASAKSLENRLVELGIEVISDLQG
jgi:hypothetical protein